ncbi:pyridoxamine 5'-phosphate oxidase-domain-containing protein [Hypoxylon fuscum]|nr:pyridoxamine 5'-phosphate oxidase-domain-containing protein [Hypoxylon fuscum]
MQHFVRRPNISSRLAQLPTHLTYRRTMQTVAFTSQGAAPWRKLFVEHTQVMASPEFSLGTIHKVSSPRTRTCIFRGLFASLPVNPKNEADLNPDVYDSDYLTFTTDCRMDKMAELFGVDEKEGNEKLLRGSGGGAPVEAMFWARETSTQWRVRGRAYVLAPDVEVSPEGKPVMATLISRMRKSSSSSSGKEWSFSREITAHFGNLSPMMRGSFRNPPPGKPVALPVKDDRLKLGQKVTDLNDEVARANFRVVVIVPDEVDRADLSDPERGRRWLYTFVGGGTSEATAPGGSVEDGWEKVEVWP